MPLLHPLMNNTFVLVQAAMVVVLKKSSLSFPIVRVMDKYFPLLHLPNSVNVVTISYPYVTVSDKICKIHPSKVPFINCDLSYIFSPTLYTIVVLNYIVSHSSSLSMNLRTIRMGF